MAEVFKGLKEHEIIEFLVYGLYIGLGFSLVPLYLLFVQKGILDEVQYFSKTLTYTIPLIGFGIILLVMRIMALMTKNNPSLYEKYGWLAGGYIHDPEQGLLPYIKIGKYEPFRWAKNPLKLFLWSFLFFFLFITIFGVFLNQWFAGLPTIEFQFTETGELLSDVYPAVPSENISLVALFSLMISILRWFLKVKIKAPNFVFWLLAFLFIVPIGSFAWLGFHNARYGGQEIAGIVTFLFGFTNLTLILLFGSIIPFEIWHTLNNLFQKADELFGSDLVKGYTIIIFIIFFIITLWISFKIKPSFEEKQKIQSPI